MTVDCAAVFVTRSASILSGAIIITASSHPSLFLLKLASNSAEVKEEGPNCGMNRYPPSRRPMVVRPRMTHIPGLGHRLLVGLSVDVPWLRRVHPRGDAGIGPPRPISTATG